MGERVHSNCATRIHICETNDWLKIEGCKRDARGKKLIRCKRSRCTQLIVHLQDSKEDTWGHGCRREMSSK